MRIRSLRLRLLVAATCAIVSALALAGFAFVLLFERHVERRTGSELDTYLGQIASRTVFDKAGAVRVEGELADPRFGKVYSGLYWQIIDEKTQRHVRSRSLWDTGLELPRDVPPVGGIHVHDIPGPQGAILLTHERRLVFDAGTGEKILRIAVAIDRIEIATLKAEFATDIVRALSLLAAVLVLAGWLQVNVGLKPLVAIRRGLSSIRGGKIKRLDVDVPTEILPLVEEVNSLLDVQDKAMRRDRDRAADLAHGLKTPLTALLGDAKRFREVGHGEFADEIERTVTLMRGHIDRELTRSRIRNVGVPAAIEAAPIVQGLLATLRRTPRGEVIKLDAKIEDGIVVCVERDDLNDILGNLLENAMRHAQGRVVINAGRRGSLIRFEVDDDGPGIAADQRKAVMERGKRMDSSAAGAGLGLAIVSDVLDYYGQKLRLNRSELGGLKASFELVV